MKDTPIEYSSSWFVNVLSREFSVDRSALSGTIVSRVNNKFSIGYQSWRPRFIVDLPEPFYSEHSLPSRLYAKDDVREEEYITHSKVWESFNDGRLSLSIPRPICFFKHPNKNRGILISELVEGRNLNDLLYASLIPGCNVFLSRKINDLLYAAGCSVGDYLNLKGFESGTLADNIEYIHANIFKVIELDSRGNEVLGFFLNSIPDYIQVEKLYTAIDYVPRNLMYLKDKLFFVDLDPIGFRHPSYIVKRFTLDMFNKTRYPMISKSLILNYINCYNDGVDSNYVIDLDDKNIQILNILADILYLCELDRSRREYWQNGANRFWLKYINQLIVKLLDSICKFDENCAKY